MRRNAYYCNQARARAFCGENTIDDTNMLDKLRRHQHFLVITALLTIVMTFPTIVYIFRTDVFWLPEKTNRDMFISFWDIWYGNQVLTGQADRFYTDLIFYPEGVSLTLQPLNFPYIMVMNALYNLMPISNAYSLSYLLIIFSNALAAYAYLLWLFEDKWLALLGAVVFGFCPLATGYPAWPSISWITPIPLVIYCAHRGIKERRANLVFLAGLFAGLTSMTIMYMFVCLLITLGLFICGLAASRWRDRVFWGHIGLLVTVLALTCSWRVLPLVQTETQRNVEHGEPSGKFRSGDVISFFVNEENPVLGPLADTILNVSDNDFVNDKSYLGFVPLTLIAIGLLKRRARRKMLPWMALLLAFIVLSLGLELSVNGVRFENIKLPKHYLNQLLPFAFATFARLNLYMAGVWLPLAVLACFGLLALRERFAIAARPGFVLALIAIVALEYYIPIDDSSEPTWAVDVVDGRTEYLDWLAQEEEGEIALVNLPFGWAYARTYSYLQSLSGYPQTEGAISHTPDSAYDYINGNYILNAWHNYRPIHCETADREAYLAALAALEADGFSHIVLHRVYAAAARIKESFDGAQASYEDDYVSVYRLEDLRASCPEALSARHFFAGAYADALAQNSILSERHGVAVILTPTIEIADHFIRFLRHNGQAKKPVVALSSDGAGNIAMRSTASVDLEAQNAIWLVQDRSDFIPKRTDENYAWLLERFRFCQRVHEDENTATDLYLRREIPCAAMSEGSALDAHYDSGLRLHKASFTVEPNLVRFYFAWTEQTEERYAFSIQFFDQAGQKALQYDHPIWANLLAVHEINTMSLPAGAYSVKLIVYDFETQISQSGMLTASQERFEREFELATIEV